MPILQVLDELPDAIARPPALVWSALARSLGEQGAAGRTALAWRWALTGGCPSPVTLGMPAGTPPRHEELLDEAGVVAELAAGTDRGGQVAQARLVLWWLAGKTDTLPVQTVRSDVLGMTSPRSRAVTEEAYSWAQLAKVLHPWRDRSAAMADRAAFGWALGAHEVLAWVCGEASEGPLSGRRTFGRPTLHEVALDASRAMTGIGLARESGDAVRARRLEAVMEAFLWLTGWEELPPVDGHGHVAFENCAERDAPCGCGAVGRCLRAGCPACWRLACVHGFGQEDGSG